MDEHHTPQLLLDRATTPAARERVRGCLEQATYTLKMAGAMNMPPLAPRFEEEFWRIIDTATYVSRGLPSPHHYGP